jgi:RimJ/RimL family protein N-acetyltransferase
VQIESERLFIKLLTLPQLRLWINEIAALEKELDCKYDAEPLGKKVLDIITNQIITTEHDEPNLVYHSFWFVIRKTDRVVIGLVYFKDIPNENNEVEICYGLGVNYRHNGYMTETVKALCKWALSQSAVCHVIAETKVDNTPSHNILKRCGFVTYKQETALWWKL